MIFNDITYSEISAVKNDVAEFISLLKKMSLEQNRKFKQVDSDFFAFLAKQMIFLKNIYIPSGKIHILSVLISDYYNYILAIIRNEHRYIYLNERSIIENYIRLILHKMVEDDFNVSQMLSKLKNDFSYVVSDEDFSLLKSEYSISSNYIHGGSALAESLAFYLEDCIERNEKFKNKSNYYENVKRILKLNVKLLISRYTDFIDGVFLRRKSLLRYLLGELIVEFLFSERQKSSKILATGRNENLYDNRMIKAM